MYKGENFIFHVSHSHIICVVLSQKVEEMPSLVAMTA